MATLATVDDARVGPRSLETEGSGSTFLGRYHSGIYRDSSLNRLFNDPRKQGTLNRDRLRRAHLGRLQGRAAMNGGQGGMRVGWFGHPERSDPPAPAFFYMTN